MPKSVYSLNDPSYNPYQKRTEMLPPVRISTPPIEIGSGYINKKIQLVDGSLQSRDYVQGTQGWKISDTYIEALNIYARGQIEATSGVIGGWSIDGTRIYKANSVFNSDGYIAFGTTPPSTYGNNIGAYLGYTGSQAKFSLYSDANNYLQWDGAKLLIKATNFTLDSSGTITATNGSFTGTITANAGTIGGHTITSTSIQTGAYNTSGTRYWGTSGFSISTNFVVDSSGTLSATGGTFTGGLLRSATSGVRWQLASSPSPRLGFYDASYERMYLTSTSIGFNDSSGNPAGTITGKFIFGGGTLEVSNQLQVIGDLYANGGLFTNYIGIDVSGVLKSSISYSTPEDALEVSGDFVAQNLSAFNAVFGLNSVSTAGNMYATAFIPTSDIRLKQDISTIQETFSKSALDIVKNLEVKTFKYIGDSDDIFVGFIAQQVQQIVPDLVYNTVKNKENKDDNKNYLGLNYVDLFAIMFEAVQELSKKIDILENNSGKSGKK